MVSNLFIEGTQEPGVCKILSDGAPEAYLKTLPPDQRASLGAADKRRLLQAAVAAHFGFQAWRLEQGSHESTLKSAKLPAGFQPGQPATPQQMDELAALNGFPEHRGKVAYLNHMLVYSACSNPEDFPALAQGYRPYDGKQAAGMDLNGELDAHDYSGPNGEKGIDNQLWRTIGCTKTFIENGDPKVARSLFLSAAAPTIIELSGLQQKGSMNAAHVTVNIYAGLDPVTRDGRGGALAFSSYRLAPDPSLRATTHGVLVNGVLTTDPVDMKLNFKEQIIDAPRVIRGGRIRMTIKPDGGVEGMIAGYYTIDSFWMSIEQMTQPGADVGGISCPGVHEAISKFADGYPGSQNRTQHRALGCPGLLRCAGVRGRRAGTGRQVGRRDGLENPMTRRGRTLGTALLAAAAGAMLPTPTPAADDAARPQGAVRRLTEAQYRASIADIFGADIKVVGRMEPDLRRGGLIAEGSGVVSVTPGAFDHYDDIARFIANQVTDPVHRAAQIGCGPGAQDPDGGACARGYFQRVGLRLYRRPLGNGEAAELASVALAGGKRLGDYYAGLSAVLAGMLASPETLFRIDAPAGKAAVVDGYSKASRLSYLLWNSTPDQALLAAAGAGTLDSQEGLAQQVDRLMASPRFRDGINAFFEDYLQLGDLDTITKDSVIYPEYFGLRRKCVARADAAHDRGPADHPQGRLSRPLHVAAPRHDPRARANLFRFRCRVTAGRCTSLMPPIRALAC